MAKQSSKHSHETSTRTTATIPSETYETLLRIAKDKKVSVAWVIREAAEEYIANRWPLLPKHKDQK